MELYTDYPSIIGHLVRITDVELYTLAFTIWWSHQFWRPSPCHSPSSAKIYTKACIGISKGNIHFARTDNDLSVVRVWTLIRISDSEYDWALKSTISVQTMSSAEDSQGLIMLRSIVPCAFDPVLDQIFVYYLDIEERRQKVWGGVLKMVVYDLNSHQLELFSTMEKLKLFSETDTDICFSVTATVFAFVPAHLPLGRS